MENAPGLKSQAAKLNGVEFAPRCGLPAALRLLVTYTMVFRVEFRVSLANSGAIS